MKKISSIGLLIAIFGTIVVVHESGHFLACKIAGVPVPRFSIGFGPVIASHLIGKTEFAISLLPLGGYISMDHETLHQKSYFIKICITSAGIIFNILCAFLLLILLFTIIKKKMLPSKQGSYSFLENGIGALNELWSLIKKTTNVLLGGIQQPHNPLCNSSISLELFDTAGPTFIFLLALSNIQIGLFNVLPIPLLDGGQLVAYTVEAILQKEADFRLLIIIDLLLFCVCSLVVRKYTYQERKR
jgi:regulator of sigma E protease